MTMSEIIRENERLKVELQRYVNLTESLHKRIVKLEKENAKLKKQNEIMMRAFEILRQICNEKQREKIDELLDEIKKSTGLTS